METNTNTNTHNSASPSETTPVARIEVCYAPKSGRYYVYCSDCQPEVDDELFLPLWGHSGPAFGKAEQHRREEHGDDARVSVDPEVKL